MGKSRIEWTDETLNPIRARYLEIQNDGSGKERVGWHCEHASEGCRNCYAESFNQRLGTGRDFKPGELYKEAKRGFNNGEVKLFLDEEMLARPLRWQRPRMVFLGSMSDLFADFVPDEWIDKVFAIMALTPQHTYQILTKRPERMRAYLSSRQGRVSPTGFKCPRWNHILNVADRMSRDSHPKHFEALVKSASQIVAEGRLPNVWLGVSVEHQKSADERIKYLVDTPAALHFLSAEPLLGPIDLTSVAAERYAEEDEWSKDLDWRFNCLRAGDDYFADEVGTVDGPIREGRVRFVICGGESGHGARPMHPDWARGLRDQCAGSDDPTNFFFKQWGEWAPGNWVLNTDDVLTFYPLDESVDLLRANSVSSGREHWWDERSMPEGLGAYRLNKSRCGRLLDGKEHLEMPDPITKEGDE